MRSIEGSEGVLIFDDTIQEKAWTDVSELMCWHYDHVSGRKVRGINLLNALYNFNGASIPVAFELVTKPTQYCDIHTRAVKGKSEVTPNELMRQMRQTCVNNDLKFRFVLTGSLNKDQPTPIRRNFVSHASWRTHRRPSPPGRRQAFATLAPLVLA